MPTPSLAPLAVAAPGAIVATIAGDLTSSTAPAATAALRGALQALEAAEGRRATLTIDLRTARMIDSVGLNLLVGTIKRARALEAEVVLAIADTSVERILTFTRLRSIATIARHA